MLLCAGDITGSKNLEVEIIIVDSKISFTMLRKDDKKVSYGLTIITYTNMEIEVMFAKTIWNPGFDINSTKRAA